MKFEFSRTYSLDGSNNNKKSEETCFNLKINEFCHKHLYELFRVIKFV